MAESEKPGMTELDIEGYGGDEAEPDSTATPQPGTGARTKGAYGDRTDAGFTGGTDFGTGAAEAAGRGGDTDTRQKAFNEQYEDTTANAGKGELFGEWDNSGVGTDLTEEMDETGGSGQAGGSGPGQ